MECQSVNSMIRVTPLDNRMMEFVIQQKLKFVPEETAMERPFENHPCIN